MQHSMKEFLKALDLSGLPREGVLSAMRRTSIDAFGELLLELPSADFPHLSELLPRKTPDDVQKQWTGNCGITLLRQSVSFVNTMVASYAELTGKDVANSNLLDFGCGWGRLLRLMLYFTPPEKLFGCDAWDVSLEHARAANLGVSLAKSDVTPDALPFPGVGFDLIYAFSIFTHLSRPVADAVLAAMRRRIARDGLAIISVRPIEFWDYLAEQKNTDHSTQMAEHAAAGFSFLPAGGIAVRAAYGDTSMSTEFIETNYPDWELLRMGATLADPFQTFVYLRPR